jgi:hypothetical protein
MRLICASRRICNVSSRVSCASQALIYDVRAPCFSYIRGALRSPPAILFA